MNFVDALKDHWGNPAMSSLSFLRSAATTAPIPEYREAATQLLEYHRESVGEAEEPESATWHTILCGQPFLEKVFSDFRLLIVPQYGGEGSYIREYDLILEIHLDGGSPRPKSFDDIEPFLGGWKTGYRGTLEVLKSLPRSPKNRRSAVWILDENEESEPFPAYLDAERALPIFHLILLTHRAAIVTNGGLEPLWFSPMLGTHKSSRIKAPPTAGRNNNEYSNINPEIGVRFRQRVTGF